MAVPDGSVEGSVRKPAEDLEPFDDGTAYAGMAQEIIMAQREWAKKLKLLEGANA